MSKEPMRVLLGSGEGPAILLGPVPGGKFNPDYERGGDNEEEGKLNEAAIHGPLLPLERGA
jgi:hypothetical protein